MSNGRYIGEIRTFGFNYPPRGWALCQGQTLPINSNAALFSLLGTQYGGNGVNTFNLPDLRGRVQVGQGQGPGISPYTIGQNGGTENATILTSNLPPHVHSFTGTLNAVQAKASSQQPTVGAFLARGADQNGTDNPQLYVPAGTAGTQVGLAGVSGTTAPTGNGIPISILQPYLAINFSIALTGIFPSRN